MTILDECYYEHERWRILMRIGMIAMMVVGMIVLNGCGGMDLDHVPTELNGKILVDPSHGKRYKLEWQEGWGHTWKFLEEAKDPSDSSKSEWFYIPERKK
jgi:hypothetical protein